ncbi:hypothetical protein [Rhizobium sp. 768_B6_N1_8]|uniref:hypothetical protein n=1 Tax=unclassified Rhizobium TaxID=2613769 RepID=UPI003F219924
MTLTKVSPALVQESAGGASGTGFIRGLWVANDVTTPATKFTVAAGVARDDADTETMELPVGLMKRLNTTWAAGNDQGCLQSGLTMTAGTWYHVHLIYNPTTDTSEIFASTSSTAPTLPAGYTKFRWFWSLLTDGSNNIKTFVQTGDDCLWKATFNTISSADDGGATGRTRAVHAPPGSKFKVRLLHFVQGATSFFTGLSDPDLSTGVSYAAVTNYHSGGETTAYVVECYTNTSAQVLSYSNVAGVSDSVISIANLGFTHHRGRRV